MKAYLILEITVNNEQLFQVYASQIPSFVEKHSGKYLVLGGNAEVIEGEWQPKKMVVIEFPSNECARSFINDPDAQSVFAMRHLSANSNVILVDGCR